MAPRPKKAMFDFDMFESGVDRCVLVVFLQSPWSFGGEIEVE